jgi:hypothetical protein
MLRLSAAFYQLMIAKEDLVNGALCELKKPVANLDTLGEEQSVEIC